MSNRLYDPRYLVGNWPLNNHADDVSGHGNNGTWSGTEDYTEGPFGKSVGVFDGSSYVEHASVATSTICYWLDGVHYAYDGTNYYTNGELSASFTVRSTATRIGESATSEISVVMHYNIALTQDEIIQLYKDSKR